MKWKSLMLFTSMVLISGCTHYYYAPNMHNVPLLQQKNELHADISGSFGDESRAIEFQTAYALSENIGFMANGFVVNREESFENDYGNGYIFEGGTGVFLPLKYSLVFETYMGMGLGKVENGYDNSSFSKINFNRYFIQPSFGYTSDFLDLAISSRICGLRYNNIQISGTINETELEAIHYINRNPFSIIIEPALTMRFGWENIKFQMQLGYSENLSNPDLMQEKINYNFGIYFTISNKYRKKKNNGPAINI